MNWAVFGFALVAVPAFCLFGAAIHSLIWWFDERFGERAGMLFAGSLLTLATATVLGLAAGAAP